MIKVGTVNIFVTDQDKAIDFYVNKLGFEKQIDMPMSPNSRWVQVGPKGKETGIALLVPEKEMPNFEDLKKRIGQMSNLIFEADDVEKIFEEFKKKGVKIIEEPKKMPWGWWGVFADQDGNTFGVHSSP